MKETKFILLIVEGNSDEAIIGEYCVQLLKSKFQEMNIKFKVTEGDTLTDSNRSKSGKRIVEDILKSYLQKSSLKANDFIQIIQVCDIDGSYFPHEQIITGSNFQEGCKPYYLYSPYQKKIVVFDQKRESVLNSWNNKKNRQDELISIYNIKGIPFNLYYNSFFLEHILYDQVDMFRDNKEEMIDKYICNNSLEEFLELLTNKNMSLDYSESWNKLKETDFSDFNSYSNMILMFKKLDLLLTESDS